MPKPIIMSKKIIITILTIIGAQYIQAQQTLDSVYIRTSPARILPEVQGVYIFSGKRTNDILPDSSGANLAANVSRMTFARIPGINVWEMDGAGTQVNIGTRGTDTHRSIETNMRQNGYATNSDVFGYPEDHYTAPMQGIREIQYVRGSSALQFGPQFGGMMNYVMKDADPSRPLAIESEQTGGPRNFFNSFNSVGGTTTNGKFSYYAYYDSRHGDGWRPNAAFNYHAYHANLTWHFTEKTKLSSYILSYVREGSRSDTPPEIDTCIDSPASKPLIRIFVDNSLSKALGKIFE